MQPNGSAFHIFSNIRLPHRADRKQVEFTAYAFNEDRVKSPTARQIYTLPTDWPVRRGKAYIITVGVNAYQSLGNGRSVETLQYAVADAPVTEQTVSKALQGQYEVIKVQLLSDYKTDSNHKRQLEPAHPTATKSNFREIFQRLAGKTNPNLLQGIPNAEKLRAATPEDIVIVSYSGHGYADENGLFYLFPYDISYKEGDNSKGFQQSAISSDDLTLWFHDVDAGQMVVILDACQSGGVKSLGFKPAPIGDRGLSQLAYDKGMIILAATQAKDSALELNSLQHGILTYALCIDGMLNQETALGGSQSRLLRADSNRNGQISMGEWLAYGADRVPLLYSSGRAGKFDGSRGQPKGIGFLKDDSNIPEQQYHQRPVLLDFRKRSQQDPIFTK